MTRQFLLKVLLVVVVATGVLLLADVWFDIFGSATLGKILLSVGIVAVTLGGWLVISRDLDDERNAKDKDLFN